VVMDPTPVIVFMEGGRPKAPRNGADHAKKRLATQRAKAKFSLVLALQKWL